MGRLMLDTRMWGAYVYHLGEPEDLMQLPDEVTRGAFYVCWSDGADLHIAGTAFLVAVMQRASDEESQGVIPNNDMDMGMYIVTAAHVIEGIKNRRKKRDVWIRANSIEGDRLQIRIPIKEWVFHPSDLTVDVAVSPWEYDTHRPTLDHTAIVSRALSSEEEYTLGIREGTDVYITGVFAQHSGRKRVIPIIRVGNIALMPDANELIETKRGLMEGYLIECRSIGGLSGSPAFACIDRIVPPITPTPPGYIPEEQYRAEIRAQYYWIGLVQGHWKIDESDLSIVTDRNDDIKEPLNTGIAVVVPARMITQVINQPHLKERRMEKLKQMKEGKMPVEDSSLSDKRKNRDIPIPSISRKKFFEDLTKATRRKKP
jgi:hypothetical protein